MRYFNYDMAKRMQGTPENEALQKYFPDSDKWGACVYFTRDKTVDFVEINTLTNSSINGATWTHFCNIQNTGEGTWEVNTQFNGKLEDEMWIYGYYKYFKGACHCAASESFLNKTRKPIKIYI